MWHAWRRGMPFTPPSDRSPAAKSMCTFPLSQNTCGLDDTESLLQSSSYLCSVQRQVHERPAGLLTDHRHMRQMLMAAHEAQELEAADVRHHNIL